MEVNLGKFGSVNIWHKDMMGKADDILILGNNARILKGKQPKKLDTFLRLRDTWEFVIKVHNENIINNNTNCLENRSCIHEEKSKQSTTSLVEYETLEDLPTDKREQVAYGEIFKTKVFNGTIEKRTRGEVENRGTWANLYILLDLAIWLDTDLKYEMYRVFIEDKILQHRDAGGDKFKELNVLIDNLPDRKGKNNQGCFITVSKLVWDKVKGKDGSKGYNEKEHNSVVQKNREEIENFAVKSIKMGIINSYPALKEFINNYPI